jgi:TonB family protein
MVRRPLILFVALLAAVAPTAASAQSSAEADLLRRIASQSSDLPAVLDLAKLYVGQGRLDEAAALTERATTLIRLRQTRTMTNGAVFTPVQMTTIAEVPAAARPQSVQAQQVQPGAPVRVGGDIKAPTKIRDVKPVYPEIAQAARVQGIVIMEAVIGTEGWVTDARVLRSVPLLDEAALDAVRQWQFTPTLLNGAPVQVLMTVTVNFTLGDRSADAGGEVAPAAGQAGAPISSPFGAPTQSPYVTAGGLNVPGAMRVGGNIKEPRKLKDVKPEYPDIARAAQVQGIVVLEIAIDGLGKVSDSRVLRGVPLLDQAAIDAVSQWEFEPTFLNGVPVPVIMTVTVNFRLS